MNTNSYEEYIYFYDNQNRLIREEQTDGEKYCNYFYDKKGNLIKIESEIKTQENKYNSKKQLIYSIESNGNEYFYKYDKKNREVFRKVIQDKDYVYEYTNMYDDKNHKQDTRTVKKFKNKVIYDFTDHYEYDLNNNLIYSKSYFSIITSEDNLISSDYEEYFYEYDSNNLPVHRKKNS